MEGNTMTTTEIDNSQDIIDSRDIIARIEELEELETACNDAREELEAAEKEEDAENIETARDAVETADALFSAEERLELAALRKLAEDAEGCADWKYGETLIRESYWEAYCQELCKDIGDIPQNLPWYIENHIDWGGVAREISMDYTDVDFDGVTYKIRS
jgi:hypothetical protein